MSGSVHGFQICGGCVVPYSCASRGRCLSTRARRRGEPALGLSNRARLDAEADRMARARLSAVARRLENWPRPIEAAYLAAAVYERLSSVARESFLQELGGAVGDDR